MFGGWGQDAGRLATCRTVLHRFAPCPYMIFPSDILIVEKPVHDYMNLEPSYQSVLHKNRIFFQDTNMH